MKAIKIIAILISIAQLLMLPVILILESDNQGEFITLVRVHNMLTSVLMAAFFGVLSILMMKSRNLK
jgi:TctA family transporter